MIMKTLLTFLILCCSFTQVGAYEFQGKEYNIRVPENIEFYTRLYASNNCDMKSYWCKVAKLNVLLVRNWFKPLY